MALKAPNLRSKPAAVEAEIEEVEAQAETAVEEEVEDEAELEETTSGSLPATAGAANQGMAVSDRVNLNEPVEGFEDNDQDLGFGSFPIMKLDGKDFMCEGHTFEKVDVVIHKGVDKYLYKARQGKPDEDIPIVYTYDRKMSVSGRPLQEYFNEWVEAGEMEPGAEPLVSKYKEVLAEVANSDTDLDGELVMLNVAPASRTRLAGYIKSLQIRGHKPQDVYTRLQAGAKVQVKKTSFHPWDFKFAGTISG